jgi:hypothetical protein
MSRKDKEEEKRGQDGRSEKKNGKERGSSTPSESLR